MVMVFNVKSVSPCAGGRGHGRHSPHWRRGAHEILEAHQRVHTAARVKGVHYSVRSQLPPDVLGVYMPLPVVE